MSDPAHNFYVVGSQGMWQISTSMEKPERDIEALATYVHGGLAALHGLAFVYNLRRRNVRDALVHGAFLTYDAIASYRHYKSH